MRHFYTAIDVMGLKKGKKKNSPTGKFSVSFLAFLATLEQRLHNHIYAMFQSLDPSISCQQPWWKAHKRLIRVVADLL